MAGTILPIVYGERQEGRRDVSVWLHALGAAVGGVAFGAVLGALGALLPRHGEPIGRAAVLASMGVAHLILAQRDLGVWHLRLPESRWQVPRAWRWIFRERIAAFVYGAALGVGILTAITSSAVYILIVWIVLTGSPWFGALLMGTFGIGRVVPLVALGTVSSNFEQVTQWEDILVRWHPAMAILNGFALAASGGWLFGVATAYAAIHQ